MLMNTNDIMCCTKCGEIEDLLEYHLAGWYVNHDNPGYEPDSGGIDYPVEYIWCGKCDEETDIEPFENWHERTTNDE
jgi:hypothetical protein